MKSGKKCQELPFKKFADLSRKFTDPKTRRIEGQRIGGGLSKSQEKYRLIVEKASEGICVVQDGRFQFINASIPKFLGYTEKELNSRLWVSFIHPDDREMVLANYRQRIQGEAVSPVYPFRITDKNGNTRWVEIRSCGIDWDGRPATLNFITEITEPKRMEKALRESEEAAKRLAQENATMAEIGRIINSTLNIEEIYERFAEKARKLIPFDRIIINVINRQEGTITNAYISGIEVAGRRPGDVIPLRGSLNEKIMDTKKSVLIQTEDPEELTRSFPTLLSTFQAGLRSMMSVPLLSQDRVIGVLHFRSTRLGAYSEKDLKLAESIAAQIAGAIANAQLFQERKRAEESLRENEKAATRLAQENSIMAEIGQIISSTLNIGEVYERFAERVRTLIPFDRIAINIIDRENMNLIIPYVLGANVAEREVGKVVPLAGTGVEWVMQNRSSLLISEENCKETFDRFPGLFPIFQTGFQSAMLIPLFSKGQVIAVLNLQSFDKNGYTETYLKLAERVSVQIAGAIANAELFQERNRADKAFRESEDGAKRLAQENAVMAEIGRIISSTLDIEEVYERFAAEARKLIPFDRIAVSLNNPGGGSATITYASGVEFEGKHIGDVFPIAHSASQEAIRSRAGLLVQPEAVEELEGRFSGLIPTFQAGLRSMITVPLISRDQVIGALHLRSKKPKAWTDRDLRLTERIGAQIAGAIANAELFTQLRKAEEEVRAREVKFKDLYDSAPVGYHEYDTEGRITNVNRTNLEMLGYSREEMIGQYIWDFNVGGDIVRQQVLEKLKGLQPPARSLERTYRRKDGSTFPVLIEDRLNKDERGRITGIRSTIQDITERKRVEGELLRAKEAADAANKAKSEFLANMSHELRTPLNHIIGFTELVVDKQCGDLNEQQREYLNDALQSSRHLLSLINDVLDLSKVEAGKLQLEVAEIRLRELLQGSLSMVKEKAMKHRIRLLSDIDGIPEAIQADERKLKQILYNLLSNAVKFTPDGGSVVLSTRYLSFREGQWFSPDGQSVGLPLVGDDLVKKGKGLIEISVQDSGIGIKGEDLQRIFNPFEQVESSASRRYQGTGLGLSLTKRLVELHGGRIWAESEGEGKGSKFILLILV